MHSTLVIRKMQINIITAHCYLRLRTGQMTMTPHTIADKDAEELKLHTSLMIQPILANRWLLNSTPALQPNHSAPRYLSQRKGNMYLLRALQRAFFPITKTWKQPNPNYFEQVNGSTNCGLSIQ